MNIFVGNLPFDATQEQVQELFGRFGNVLSVVIVMNKDKKAPKSRGFGFVEMPDDQQAREAIAGLNGNDFMGRALNVSEARPKTDDEREREAQERKDARAAVKALYREQAELKRKNELLEKKHAWMKTTVPRPGTYRGGRRSQSYIRKQNSASSVQGENGQGQPASRPGGPWRKRPAAGSGRPEQKRPWQQRRPGRSPWQKRNDGDSSVQGFSTSSRPFRRDDDRRGARGEVESRKGPGVMRSDAAKKPWQKKAGEAPSLGPREGGFKPWERKSKDSSVGKPYRKYASKPQPWKRGGNERPASRPVTRKPRSEKS
jgi:RNA recognition motif-containing protein